MPITTIDPELEGAITLKLALTDEPDTIAPVYVDVAALLEDPGLKNMFDIGMVEACTISEYTERNGHRRLTGVPLPSWDRLLLALKPHLGRAS